MVELRGVLDLEHLAGLLRFLAVGIIGKHGGNVRDEGAVRLIHLDHVGALLVGFTGLEILALGGFQKHDDVGQALVLADLPGLVTVLKIRSAAVSQADRLAAHL